MDKLTRTQEYENNCIISELNKQCGLTVISIELLEGKLLIKTKELLVDLVATKKQYGYSIDDNLGNHACIVSKDNMYPTNIITPSSDIFEVCCEKCQCYDECECEEYKQNNKANQEELTMDKLNVCVETKEMEVMLLAGYFGDVENNDFKEEINDVETFEYISHNRDITIITDYNYKENKYCTFIFSTNDYVHYDEVIKEDTLLNTFESLRKHYNKLNTLLSPYEKLYNQDQ